MGLLRCESSHHCPWLYISISIQAFFSISMEVIYIQKETSTHSDAYSILNLIPLCTVKQLQNDELIKLSFFSNDILVLLTWTGFSGRISRLRDLWSWFGCAQGIWKRKGTVRECLSRRHATARLDTYIGIYCLDYIDLQNSYNFCK